MRRSHWSGAWALIRLLGAAVLAAVLAACGGGGTPENAGAAAELRGWAHVDGPLVGARVRVLAIDGRELARAERPTYVTGTWHVSVPQLPDAYTVEVTGGSVGGRPFHGTLLHTDQAYDGRTPLDVNAATTLAARFQAQHPEMPAAEVDAAVRRFLSLPGRVELDRHLRANNAHFSGARFLAAMPAGQAFDAHVDALVGQIADGDARSYATAQRLVPLRGQPARARALAVDTPVSGDEAGQDAAQILLAAATGGPEGAEAAVGNILISKIFGGGGAEAAIVSLLQDISKKLDAITHDLAGLTVAIDRLEQHVDDAAYADQIRPLDPLLLDIDNQWTLYDHLIQSDPAHPKAMKAARQAFMDAMVDTEPDKGCTRRCRLRQAFDSGSVQQVLVGAGGAKGALELWNTKVLTDRKSGSRFVGAGTQADAQVAFRFWRTQQVKLYVLLTEYGHAVRSTHPQYLDPAWKAQYGSSETGTRFVEQSAAADHVDQIVPLATGLRYDRALGIVWAADLSSYSPSDFVVLGLSRIYHASGLVWDGNDLYDFLPRALARVEQLSGLSGWELPNVQMLVSLTHAVGRFDGPRSEDGDTRNVQYLVRNGFGSWLLEPKWNRWTYAGTSEEGGVPHRALINLDTGYQHASCDGMGPGSCPGNLSWAMHFDPWRLTPGGFLPMRPVGTDRFLPDGW